MRRVWRAGPRSASFLLSLLLLVPVAQVFGRDSQPVLAIVEKVSGCVGFYTEDGRRTAGVKVGNFPHEAILSPDHRYLYVADNGVLWMTENGSGDNTISIIDVAAEKKTGVIDLGRFRRPHGLAIDPLSGHLFSTTERPARLIVIDTHARKVIRDYDVKGLSPHMVALGPDHRWAFVSNVNSGTVSAINLESGQANVIPTGARAQGTVLSPDGSRLYVVNTGADSISIIDTKQQKVIGTIRTGKGPGRIRITPDSKTLAYNLQFEPGMGFADVASGKQVATIPLDGRPLSLTMTRDGKRAFAGVQEHDKVYVISVQDRRIVRVINTPKNSGPDPAIPLADDRVLFP
jgi:YVTN family beta-propeller protein